jgi:hypothetical protein
MLYVKVSNGSVQFPYTIGQLRKDNPNTSFPAYITEATLANYSVFPVTEVAAPVVDPLTQRHEQTTPTQVDGKWTQVWQVIDLTEDQAAANVRAERDRRLADTDWTQVLDAPVDRTAWATYRQQLRNVPQQESFPFNVVWPTQS